MGDTWRWLELKLIKCLIVSILLSVGILFSGELYQLYCEECMDFYDVSVKIDENVSVEKLLEDVKRCATDYGIEIFCVDYKYQSSKDTTITVYSTDKVKNILKDDYKLNAGKRKSMFCGNTVIVYKNFDELEGVLGTKVDGTFYAIGNKYAVRDYFEEMVEEYDMDFPVNMENGAFTETEKMLIVVWAGIIGIILFITYYELVKGKKEQFVHMTMGADVKGKMLKVSIIEGAIYGISFSVVMGLVLALEGGIYAFEISLMALFVLIFLNVLVHLLCSRVDYKQDIAGAANDKLLLLINYTYKIIITALVLIVVSTNIYEMDEYFDMKYQEDLYNNMDDYYYVSIGRKINNDAREGYKVTDYIYYNKMEEYDICQFVWCNMDYDEPSFCKDNRIISANSNMLWYIKASITELENEDFSKPVYAILPMEYKDMENDIKKWVEYNNGIGFEVDEVEVLYYKNDVKLAVQWNDEFNSLKNPIIMYKNIDYMKCGDYQWEELNSLDFFAHPTCSFYKVTEAEFEALVNSYGYKMGNFENVKEHYQNRLVALERAFLCNLGITILLIGIEIGIVMSLIKLEYDINRKSLIISKILGKSRLARFKKLYLSTIITGVLCIVVAVKLASKYFNMNNPELICAGGIVILLLEFIFVTWLCNKNDKECIQRILKNGF